MVPQVSKKIRYSIHSESGQEVIDRVPHNRKLHERHMAQPFHHSAFGFSFTDHSPISDSNETLLSDSSDAALVSTGRVPNIRN